MVDGKMNYRMGRVGGGIWPYGAGSQEKRAAL